jgi:endonuclease/exonuclease/phosphatase family metal-dependent hydrolase
VNILGAGPAWGLRQDALASGIARLAPDVIALQEVVVAGDRDDARDLVVDEHHIIQHRNRDRAGLGCALVTRHPIVGQWHTEPDDDPTSWWSTVIAEIAVPNLPSPVLVGHHKPWWGTPREADREAQAAHAVRMVESAARGRHVPVVLCGDFDARPDSASIRFLTGRQSLDGVSVCYEDAWEATGHTGDDPTGATFPSPDPRHRIDYVMLRDEEHPILRFTRCERVFTEQVGETWPSDHLGVVADLGLTVDETPTPAATR